MLHEDNHKGRFSNNEKTNSKRLTLVNIRSESKLYTLNLWPRVLKRFYEMFRGEIGTHVQNHGFNVRYQPQNAM